MISVESWRVEGCEEERAKKFCHPERSATTSKDPDKHKKGSNFLLLFAMENALTVQPKIHPLKGSGVDRVPLVLGGVLRRRCTPLRMTEVLVSRAIIMEAV